jgi:hypothetical protein
MPFLKIGELIHFLLHFVSLVISHCICSYDTFIPTVRSAKVSNISATSVAAEFALSKFRLKVNVVMKTHPEENAITFRLDRERPNLVMREAEGFWLVESPPDRPGYTRVWLGANIVVSRLVPTVIVDYAAARALPRATSWLHSYFPAKIGQVE